jgi:hypothetical protein
VEHGDTFVFATAASGLLPEYWSLRKVFTM